ncbi:PTS system transporter subunit IIC [Companilactobacillus paralimentarius DSM 13238 = JCM 10415]|uniref:Permease IIC component n=1 Tax=Companilactobacillus paralimentarius DSM 13238 = JCM 10415 TaxID=1122151 RepID=A0A0R1PM16_9LACO|nr:PTS transporter subunit EIIC [Companilactobacillus paralimentarius]KAE9564608.1 PTS trehalose transporter subunit IIBC [Companilactobacillus paralimentarius]KRL31106.1 PTS system transporter subunit IIC [Companilactobacillus paralimentarius DSM 13238 = JCM 10415]MDR4934153.1 PTS transporter subunit EIIC [Companilactobacillus paralimentarius]QFR70535.1 PTS sugar transporter subunit IIC [Companilactobacillus paralimentarius]
MVTRLLNFFAQIRNTKVASAVRNTLTLLFPIMLLGSFADVIKFAFLTKTGYMAQMFGVTSWLPYSRELGWVMEVIFHCTIDMIALYAAYGIAYFTAKEYKKDGGSAGAIGLLSFLIISYQPTEDGLPNFSRFFMSQGMLIALIIGYLCGRLWVRFDDSKMQYRYKIIIPVFIVLLVSAILNLAGLFLVKLEIPTYVASFVTQHSPFNSLVYVLGMGFLTDLLSWMAVGGPFSNNPTFNDAPSMANMNAALKSGSSWNVPYKFTDTTLFHSFANFGGSGVMIALIIAILIFSKKTRNRNVAKWSIFPAIFNSHYSMMLGIPVLFNPVFLVPFLITPLFNMIVAAMFILLHWMPVSAYPVPLGTPGPLIAFIGTNGNWVTLVLGAILLVIDILIYMPFVKLSDRISQKAGDINEN